MIFMAQASTADLIAASVASSALTTEESCPSTACLIYGTGFANLCFEGKSGGGSRGPWMHKSEAL
jgi:hypothetical protein